MTFEEYMRRPIYVAQCRSWAKAAELDLCCARFRALLPYRDAQALRARKAVAAALRLQRKERRHA